jgi:hypothetical protein
LILSSISIKIDIERLILHFRHTNNVLLLVVVVIFIMIVLTRIFIARIVWNTRVRIGISIVLHTRHIIRSILLILRSSLINRSIVISSSIEIIWILSSAIVIVVIVVVVHVIIFTSYYKSVIGIATVIAHIHSLLIIVMVSIIMSHLMRHSLMLMMISLIAILPFRSWRWLTSWTRLTPIIVG